MYEAEVTIKGITSYGANAMVPDDAPMDVRKKPANETWDSYMRRVLPYTIHTDKKTGNLIIPANALKLCVTSAAQLDGIKVPNRGSMTYGKLFKVGVKIPRGLFSRMMLQVLNLCWNHNQFPPMGDMGGQNVSPGTSGGLRGGEEHSIYLLFMDRLQSLCLKIRCTLLGLWLVWGCIAQRITATTVYLSWSLSSILEM